MNRGLTGLLAWSALALVIAVPSAEILLNRPDEVASETKVFVGPPSATSPNLAADNGAAEPLLPFQPDVAPMRVVLPTQSKALPLPPIVPAGAPKTKAVADEVLVLPIVPSSEPAVETAALDSGAQTPTILNEPEYVGAESLIVSNAPVPMPAPARPLKSAVITPLRAPQTQLEQDVSQSIATVRTTVRTAPQLRGDVIKPDSSNFWGDDPRYRGRQNLQTFNPDDASDSAFFEGWQAGNRPPGFLRRGSFEEQLPARRGSAVRLDLLQR